jgi:RNA polymerase Rpb3/Rpb11 dimerisation domain
MVHIHPLFTVNIESAGAIPPQDLFVQAVGVLIEKIKAIKPALAQATGESA